MGKRKLITRIAAAVVAASLGAASIAWAATVPLSTLGSATTVSATDTLAICQLGSACTVAQALVTATMAQLKTYFGGGTVTSVTLAPGLAKTIGTQNTGSDAVTTTGTINGQLWPVLKSSGSPYTVLAADTGNMLIAGAASYVFNAPNPASGTKGTRYQFGSDGTNGFTLTTTGGTATFYGCNPGNGTASFVVPVNVDITIIDDGTNYVCRASSSQIIPVALTYPPGINPNNLPMANIKKSSIIVGIRCTPEVAAGGTATISVVKAASATAISAGTLLHSGSCNANGTAATDQDLTVTVTTLAAGDRLGVQATGTTIWTSAGVAAGVVTVFIR